jgi:hypothetical protein
VRVIKCDKCGHDSGKLHFNFVAGEDEEYIVFYNLGKLSRQTEEAGFRMIHLCFDCYDKLTILVEQEGDNIRNEQTAKASSAAVFHVMIVIALKVNDTLTPKVRYENNTIYFSNDTVLMD